MLSTRFRNGCAAVAICTLFVTSAKPGRADTAKNDAIEAGIAIGAVGAAIGVGIYILVRHDHSITGCAQPRSDGLELHSENDNQTYALIGDVTSIKPGERVRLSGKKKKTKDAAGNSSFLVEKLSKDYGACKP